MLTALSKDPPATVPWGLLWGTQRLGAERGSAALGARSLEAVLLPVSLAPPALSITSRMLLRPHLHLCKLSLRHRHAPSAPPAPSPTWRPRPRPWSESCSSRQCKDWFSLTSGDWTPSSDPHRSDIRAGGTGGAVETVTQLLCPQQGPHASVTPDRPLL